MTDVLWLQEYPHRHPVDELEQGRAGSVLWIPSADRDEPAHVYIDPSLPSGSLVLPGSFNPLHAGHEQLLHAARRVACDLRGLSPESAPAAVFELSRTNADKPALAAETLQSRVEQFVQPETSALWGGRAVTGASDTPWPILVTQAPLFHQKAPLLRGCWFVVGYDTVKRILQPKYYGDDPTAISAILAMFHTHGSRFLVAGRVESARQDGHFLTLQDLNNDIPACFRPGNERLLCEYTATPGNELPLFMDVPEHEFRCDMASTDIRARAAGDTST